MLEETAVGSKKFKISDKKMPVFVDETGDMCTNLKEIKSYEMLAFAQSVADSLFNFNP